LLIKAFVELRPCGPFCACQQSIGLRCRTVDGFPLVVAEQ
jgi:hypothetical protein